MYAIANAAGRYFKFNLDSRAVIDAKLGLPVGSEIVFDKVALIENSGQIKIGKPFIEGAMVKAEVIEAKRLPKIRVLKRQSKKAWPKSYGHRQDATVLKIKEIIGG